MGDIKAVEYSSVVTAPPKDGTPPPKPEDKGALVTLGESNVSSEVNEDGYWAFLPAGLLMFPLPLPAQGRQGAHALRAPLDRGLILIGPPRLYRVFTTSCTLLERARAPGSDLLKV